VPIWELMYVFSLFFLLVRELTTIGVSSVVRMGVTALGCVVWLRLSGDPHPYLGPPGVRFLLCIRGIVGFFGMSRFLSIDRSCTIRDK